MEKSSHSSFLKSLALAFGDGLLFGVAMKLAQGPSKTREDEMTDLGPLAERLRKVEDHTQTIDKDALVKFGEGLDGRVLEKVIVALEARLTEHVGQVDRRLAEIDAQVALDLKAVDTHTAAQTNAVEKAIQQIEAPGSRLRGGGPAIQRRADCRSGPEALRAAGSPAGQVPRDHRSGAAIHGSARCTGIDGTGKPRVGARGHARAIAGTPVEPARRGGGAFGQALRGDAAAWRNTNRARPRRCSKRCSNSKPS